MPGEIVGVEGNVAEVKLAAGANVVLPADRLPTERGPVSVGVRPEKLEIRSGAASHTDDGTNWIDATVHISTYTGVSTSYECRTADGSKIVVYVQNLGTDVESLGGGAKVRLAWDPEHTFAVSHNGVETTKEEAG